MNGDPVDLQTALFAPGVVDVTLRVGLIPRENHLQWQLEVRNAVTDELLAMESRPHASIADLESEIARATRSLILAARAVCAAGENGELPSS